MYQVPIIQVGNCAQLWFEHSKSKADKLSRHQVSQTDNPEDFLSKRNTKQPNEQSGHFERMSE